MIRGAPVALVIYPGATHAFNNSHAPGQYFGHAEEYNPTEAEDARGRTWTFLKHMLEPSSLIRLWPRHLASGAWGCGGEAHYLGVPQVSVAML
jgi:hypothetical protein